MDLHSRRGGYAAPLLQRHISSFKRLCWEIHTKPALLGRDLQLTPFSFKTSGHILLHSLAHSGSHVCRVFTAYNSNCHRYPSVGCPLHSLIRSRFLRRLQSRSCYLKTMRSRNIVDMETFCVINGIPTDQTCMILTIQISIGPRLVFGSTADRQLAADLFLCVKSLTVSEHKYMPA